MDKNVVVTGISLINEFIKEEVFKNLFHSTYYGRLEDYSGLVCPPELKNKFIDITPCSIYGFNAAELALSNVFADDENIDHKKWAVYNGTEFGGYTNRVHTICNEYKKSGTRGLLPGIFNNKNCNVTADIVAIRHKIMGANITFMSGRLASGMAIMQAFDDVMDDALSGAVVIGTEVIDDYIIKGHKILGEENTNLFASGACSLVIQALEDINTNKIPFGYIRAVEAAYCKDQDENYYNNHLCDGLKRAMECALSKSDIAPDNIDIIVSGQGKSEIEVSNYKKAYQMVFGENYESRTFNSKDVLGESLGAFPAMSTALGLMILDKQKVPFNHCNTSENIKYVMVTADDPDGNALALILEQYIRK